VVLATGCGVGYSPVAPGTVGSLLGLLYWWLLVRYTGEWWGYLVVTVAGLLFAVGVSGAAARRLGAPDPPVVVIDEICAVPLALLAGAGPHWPVARTLVAFVLFRVFDIWKPWPIGPAQRLPGGWGIVLDDVLAAALAFLITEAVWRGLALAWG
jgi:phosphatidylglycerophosphatase A